MPIGDWSTEFGSRPWYVSEVLTGVHNDPPQVRGVIGRTATLDSPMNPAGNCALNPLHGTKTRFVLKFRVLSA